jgi:HPt (histidine-containing phosphotransfer) domain-containing protein
MGGMEALQAMRLMTRASGRLPVAMLSADVTPEVKREALEAGFDAFLPKPIEALRLLEEVQALSLLKVDEARRADGQGVSVRLPRAAGAAAVAVANAETLGHLEELSSSPAFVEKLIGVFVADSSALLARVEQALNARNLQEFRSLLHAMKGSSASMGTDRLTALCGDLGRLSDSELRLQASGLLRSISDEFGAARDELERYLRERKRSAG